MACSTYVEKGVSEGCGMISRDGASRGQRSVGACLCRSRSRAASGRIGWWPPACYLGTDGAPNPTRMVNSRWWKSWAGGFCAAENRGCESDRSKKPAVFRHPGRICSSRTRDMTCTVGLRTIPMFLDSPCPGSAFHNGEHSPRANLTISRRPSVPQGGDSMLLFRS